MNCFPEDVYEKSKRIGQRAGMSTRDLAGICMMAVLLHVVEEANMKGQSAPFLLTDLATHARQAADAIVAELETSDLSSVNTLIEE